MPERTVKIGVYSWFHPVFDEDGVEVGSQIKEAHPGDVIDVTDEEAARGDALGFFHESPAPTVDDGEYPNVLLDIDAMTPDQLVEWLGESSAQVVKDNVGDDAVRAAVVADAEEARPEGRKTLIAALRKLS